MQKGTQNPRIMDIGWRGHHRMNDCPICEQPSRRCWQGARGREGQGQGVRARVVQRLLGSRIREVEPVLEKVDAQHPLDSTAVFRFRIKGFWLRPTVSSPCHPENAPCESVFGYSDLKPGFRSFPEKSKLRKCPREGLIN